jgi:ATP-dependent 26S proteasome regulatory subunit
VSWILQLVEESENAVILLASNRREAIDEAFLRRFRFIIEFPMPDAALRRELWRRSFPAQVALSDVSFDALAERLPISGASIRNIALAASFMAANDGGVVHAGFIAQAARREMEKMGRPVSFGEHEFAVRKASR